MPAAFRSRAAIGRESLKQRRPESSDRTASPVALARAREKKKKTRLDVANRQEYVNGQLKNKYGDAFVRGNNVLYISAVKDT